MTITDKLAAALQALANRYVLANPADHAGAEMTAACDALAVYHAQAEARAAVTAARDALSEAIEDPDGGNDEEHDAAVDLLQALNALDIEQ